MCNLPGSIDLSLELMKLSVRAGSSSLYQKAAKRLQDKLLWTPKKLNRILSGADELDEMEFVIVKQELILIKRDENLVAHKM
ncbi:hypothetical protein GC194_11570 [bacterium]|nr:hypothetical protein [bacterium]